MLKRQEQKSHLRWDCSVTNTPPCSCTEARRPNYSSLAPRWVPLRVGLGAARVLRWVVWGGWHRRHELLEVQHALQKGVGGRRAFQCHGVGALGDQLQGEGTRKSWHKGQMLPVQRSGRSARPAPLGPHRAPQPGPALAPWWPSQPGDAAQSHVLPGQGWASPRGRCPGRRSGCSTRRQRACR